jgi:hypothetical protein
MSGKPWLDYTDKRRLSISKINFKTFVYRAAEVCILRLILHFFRLMKGWLELDSDPCSTQSLRLAWPCYPRKQNEKRKRELIRYMQSFLYFPISLIFSHITTVTESILGYLHIDRLQPKKISHRFWQRSIVFIYFHAVKFNFKASKFKKPGGLIYLKSQPDPV